MKKFVPVIIAAVPLESFSANRNPVLAAISAVSDPGRYRAPILVTQSAWLDTAIALAGVRAGSVTFVSAPDGSGATCLAAVGCAIADALFKEAPILIMDARTDRTRFGDYSRHVSKSVGDVDEGSVVAFTSKRAEPPVAAVLRIAPEGAGYSSRIIGFSSDSDDRHEDDETTTGDYAFTFETISCVFEASAPGLMSYVDGAIANSGSNLNVVTLPDALYFSRGTESFEAAILASNRDLRAVTLSNWSPAELYTPWQGSSGSRNGFYAAH